MSRTSRAIATAWGRVSASPAEAPEVEIYSELSGDASWFTRRAAGLRIPMNVRIERLGAGLEGAATADVPRYPQLLRFAFDAGRLDPRQFEGYRIRIEFPLLPTGVSLVRTKVEASRGSNASNPETLSGDTEPGLTDSR
jgi:hypothetical protein